jgi:hypothetical protein
MSTSYYQSLSTPVFWFVREEPPRPYLHEHDYIGILLTIIDSLESILTEDMHDRVAPHPQDLELLALLRSNLLFVREHYHLQEKHDPDLT